MSLSVHVIAGACAQALLLNPPAPPAARIVASDSAILECKCPGDPLPCAAPVRRTAAGLRNALDSLGYFAARWDTLGSGRFAVTPGGRAVVAAESLAAAGGELPDSLPPARLPEPYDAGRITKRLAAIARRLAETGHPFGRITVSIDKSPAMEAAGGASSAPSLTVRYRIEPGRPCLFGPPVVTGAKATGRKTLLHDILITEGSSFDVRKIEETVDGLQRRSYIYAAAAGAPALLPEPPPGKHDSALPAGAEWVSVPLAVRDRSGLGIEGALGYASHAAGQPALQGDLTLSFSNLFHAGENASLLYAGDKTYQKFSMETMVPWIFGSPLTGTASFGLEVHENNYGFLEGMLKAFTEVSRQWRAGMSVRGSETALDTAGSSWKYYGADFFLTLPAEPLSDGIWAREFDLTTGGGIAERERNYSRSHVDFTGGLQAPLWRHQALRVRLVTGHLFSNETGLVPAELYRTGGYRSVRGYFENEFAFRTVMYDQLEYLYYFNSSASAYIFLDSGFGFEKSITQARRGDRRDFLGYGLGIRVPARLGRLSLEWARNIDDTKSLGRVHVAVNNTKQ